MCVNICICMQFIICICFCMHFLFVFCFACTLYLSLHTFCSCLSMHFVFVCMRIEEARRWDMRATRPIACNLCFLHGFIYLNTTVAPTPSPGNGILHHHHHHHHASYINESYTNATYTDDNIVHGEWWWWQSHRTYGMEDGLTLIMMIAFYFEADNHIVHGWWWS